VVDRVGRLVRSAKAGHAGTLDPLASGVLVVAIGPATRLVPYVQRLPKHYRAVFLLGRHSPTDDTEGQVTELVDPPRPSRVQIDEAAAALVGQIEQRPPDFSAVKVAGRRAYRLARAGKPVPLEPRTISVYRLHVVWYEYPELELDIECGSGTYVRSLGRDLAAQLGTAAVMAALVRTAIGPFTLARAVELDALTASNLSEHLLSPLEALVDMPHVTVSDDDVRRLGHGQTVAAPDIAGDECATEVIDERAAEPANECAAVDSQGRLVAILKRRGDGSFGPKISFRGDAS
jgi:tRNA pseudouridine55 synthase